ncbi:MAG: type II toxin-antitoxin system VapB family antitoxin [candidate division NC10 bacterium]|nr:type II toxin-antitoxin system VapB family antitoxin [candidate division NC10 bacterium]MDE2321319.1 type II toxin-antitoxin system VapB family antitoxin [candidate division NC10 bacterium]
MKTTIEVTDTLLRGAKQLAANEGTTLRALVEEGLRRILAEREQGGRFHLRKATFKGSGIQPGLATASWDRIREMIYEGRGG